MATAHLTAPSATLAATGTKPLWVFTPSRTDPKDLEFILVQRQDLIQDAVERVRESALTEHKHHLLFVGARGCGKTHLVTLIVSRLTEDTSLADALRIAWLNEDETCTTLLELLLKIHTALAARYPEEFRESDISPAYELKAEAALDLVTQQLLSVLGHRTLLVVLENLDALFEGLGDAGQKGLRAFIQEHPKVSIIATAQRLVEDLSSRASPFFGFFQTEHLKTLNVDEANQLLQKIAQLQGKDSLVAFLATNQGRSRVRALHHLSRGNHRIYIVLSQFITRDTIDDLLGPFMKMVDELTPYYQERIRWLPPLQRKIVEFLCACEGTVPVKDIAKRLFSTSQVVSSQLKDLREKGYVASNQRGRESLYEISEPLMRICVEVKDNQRLQPLRLLVDFLRVWYDENELKRRFGDLTPVGEIANYLASAIQRNGSEGNLRQKLLLEDFQLSLPVKLDAARSERLIQDFKALPEPAALAMQLFAEGKQDEAYQCLYACLAEEPDMVRQGEIRKQVAETLLYRGATHGEAGEIQRAMEDFTAVIGLAGAPLDQVAKALFNRGMTYDLPCQAHRAIEDYTAVIGLADAPVEPVVRALLYRGLTHDQLGETQRAIEDYTAVIGMAGSAAELVAYALFNRGATHSRVGETQREIEDYTAVIGLMSAPVELVALALLNRGNIQSESGETQRAIEDYKGVIELAGATVEQVAEALLYRGVTYGQAGEIQRAIADYTAVIELMCAPVELVAKALVNRGVTHRRSGENERAIADYTAVIGLTGLPVDQVAHALFNRGVTHGQVGETQHAIEDYTAIVGLTGAPVELLAKAWLSRGMTHHQSGEIERAMEDYTAVIGLAGAPLETVAKAMLYRGTSYSQMGRIPEAKSELGALVVDAMMPLPDRVEAYLLIALLNFIEGRWHEGFEAIDASLACGEAQQPPYRASVAAVVGGVFSAGLNPDGRLDKVAELLRVYGLHNALPVLGDAVVTQVGHLFQAGEPFPATDNLEAWAQAWETAAVDFPDFSLSMRLLRAGIDFVKAGGKDAGILLSLSSTERTIVEQALGL